MLVGTDWTSHALHRGAVAVAVAAAAAASRARRGEQTAKMERRAKGDKGFIVVSLSLSFNSTSKTHIAERSRNRYHGRHS